MTCMIGHNLAMFMTESHLSGHIALAFYTNCFVQSSVLHVSVSSIGMVAGGGRRPRRMVCKNCGANQTPQWRCGPDGPRTLCNACGVRYKKGLPLTGGAMNGSS